jgi:lysophospholipase L1-like esterase
VPAPADRRSLLRAALLLAIGLVSACGSDRGTLTAPSFEGADASAPTAGPGVSADVDTDSDIQSVAMVGDSITVGSVAPLQDGFQGLGLDVRAIDADYGRRITVEGSANGSGLDAVNALAASNPPDLWVIALGTNDVLQYAGAEEYRAAIGALLTAVPVGAPVVWVDTYLAEDPAQCDEFNTALRDTLDFRGTASVADWAAVASGEGVLADGVHPSAEGTQQFAAVVMAAVQPWLGN